MKSEFMDHRKNILHLLHTLHMIVSQIEALESVEAREGSNLQVVDLTAAEVNLDETRDMFERELCHHLDGVISEHQSLKVGNRVEWGGWNGVKIVGTKIQLNKVQQTNEGLKN